MADRHSTGVALVLATSHRPEISTSSDAPPRHMRGHSLAQKAFRIPSSDCERAVLEVTHSAFPPDVEAGDFICVDFTKARVCCDGLYVLTFGGDDPDWIGIRRFQVLPDGLYIYENRCAEFPRKLSPQEAEDIRIVGWIKDVYKRW